MRLEGAADTPAGAVANPKIDPKDPRFRRYRVTAYSVYLVVVTVFSLGIIASVFRSVADMSPRRPAESAGVLTPRECGEGLEGLWQRLESERRVWSEQQPAHGADDRYTIFRNGWMREFRELEGKCAVDARSRSGLKTAFRRLEEVQDAYTILAAQYAGHTGPKVEGFVQALEAAKRGQDAAE